MAGTAERTLALKLIADVGSLDKDLKKVDSRLARTGRAAASWGKAFAGALAIGGIERAVDLIGDAWEGFRSGQRVAAQLGVTWKNLGLEATRLGATLDKVTTSATNLGFSDDEAVMAFNRALNATKDQDAAMRRLKIAYDLVANGAAPDLNSAMQLIQQAARGSARVTDRFGLTAKTAGGRVKQLGERVKGAAQSKAALDPLGVLFNQMNEDLEGIVGSLATGEVDAAIEAAAGAGDHLAEAWAKLGGVVPAPLRDFADNVAPKVQAMAQAAASAVGSLGTAFDATKPLIQPVLDLLGATLASTTDGAVKALNVISDLLRGDFAGAWRTVTSVIVHAVQGWIAAWNRLDMSVPPFELSWGGGTVLPGTPFAFDIPAGSFRFWSGTGDLFPDVGRSWDMPSSGKGPSGGVSKATRKRNSKLPPPVRLPGHKDGLDYVPFDNYPALLHKGERVMTAAENRGGGSNYSISVYVAPGGDLVDAGRQMVRAIREYEKRGGASWRN